MLKILTGVISGIVSGTGMGGGTILILILSVFMRNRPAHSTSDKFSFFCANFLNSNISIFERTTNRLEKWNSNCNFRNNWSNIWS